jgi:hypothetical protein
MDLLTPEEREQLLANGRANAGRAHTQDFKPVVKLYCPWSLAIWLLTELDPDNPDIAFGLCDPGAGFPELGEVSLNELANVEGPDGLRIERDPHFTPTQTLAGYARGARVQGRIVF